MNITSDPSGIGNWTKDQFVQRFRMYADPSYVLPGVDLAKGDLQSVLPWTMYAGMTTEDLGAIYELQNSSQSPINTTLKTQLKRPMENTGGYFSNLLP